MKNRRRCSLVWGEPITLDLPRTGRGYKEGAAVVEQLVIRLWRRAAQATADGFPEVLPDGLRRAGFVKPKDFLWYPDLATWPEDDWAAGPLGPVYRGPVAIHTPDAGFTQALHSRHTLPTWRHPKRGFDETLRRCSRQHGARDRGDRRDRRHSAAFGSQVERPLVRTPRKEDGAQHDRPSRRRRSPSFAGSTSSAAAASATGTTTTRSSTRGSPASRTTIVHRQRHDERVLDARVAPGAVDVLPSRRRHGRVLDADAASAPGRRSPRCARRSTTVGTRGAGAGVPARSEDDRRQLEGHDAQALKVTYWNCGPGRRRPPQSTIPTCPEPGARPRPARRVPGLLGRRQPRHARPPEPHGVLGPRPVPGRPSGRGAGDPGQLPLRERGGPASCSPRAASSPGTPTSSTPGTRRCSRAWSTAA